MERFIQHDPLFIRHFKTLKWPFPVHNHNHFELIFIHSGSGFHQLNGKSESYHSPCLFLLAPADYHIFDIQVETEFSVLKFTNNYLDGTSSSGVHQEWNKLIDQLLAISSVYGSCLVKSEHDLKKIDQMMRLIVVEWQESLNVANEVLLYQIRSVFALIKRNAIYNKVPDHLINGNMFISIVDYIHTNIHEPKLLRIEVMSKLFNFSPNHLSTLFKQQMGVALKRYIDDYKFKLIENRLKFSAVLLKEVSNEFGFSDISHLNKFFKKHAGVNPKSYRSK